MHFLCGIDTSDGAPAVAYVAARVAEQLGAELTLARVVAGGHAEMPARELGATARGWMADAFRGGMRDALVAQAECPVMVVPPGSATTGRGVAVAYDTFANSAGAAAVAAHLASALDERLTVIHLLPDPRSSTCPCCPCIATCAVSSRTRSTAKRSISGTYSRTGCPPHTSCRPSRRFSPRSWPSLRRSGRTGGSHFGLPSARSCSPSFVSRRRRGRASARPVHRDGGRSVGVNAISNEMVRIYKEQFGRGPTRTRTAWVGPDMLLVTLEDSFTPAELNLRQMGEHERLRELRLLYRDAEAAAFCEPVERLTGRKVRAFISGIDTRADVSSELFVLHPVGYDGSCRADLRSTSEPR